MHVLFRNAEITDLPVLTGLVEALYTEDPSPRQPTPDHTRLTFAQFEKYPEKGRIQMFEVAGKAVGYALLVHFWSNEYGGNKIIIDEIFVQPEYRGKGIARLFFRYLEQEYPLPAVALELEVTPDNHAARRLYESAGFRLAKNKYFNKLIRHAND